MKILISVLLCSSILFGADFAVISDLGSSARSIGMGNIKGFSFSADTLFDNPAGLTRISDNNISAFNTTLLDDVHYYSLALASNIKYGTIGVGIYQANITNIPETYLNQSSSLKKFEILNTFDYKDSIFKVGYAFQKSDTLSIGITGTLYDRSYYSISGSAVNFDIGMIKQFKYVDLSVVAENVIPKTAFVYSDGSEETIPSSLYASLKASMYSVELYPQVRITDNQLLYSVGMIYDPAYIPLLHFLMGYKQHLSYTYEKQETGTIGIGLNLLGMSFYYAFEKSDYTLNDNNSYFSASFNF